MSDRFIKALYVNDRINYILTDYVFWAAHDAELSIWLDGNTEQGSDSQFGMVLEFANEREELLFLLKWSG